MAEVTLNFYVLWIAYRPPMKLPQFSFHFSGTPSTNWPVLRGVEVSIVSTPPREQYNIFRGAAVGFPDAGRRSSRSRDAWTRIEAPAPTMNPYGEKSRCALDFRTH